MKILFLTPQLPYPPHQGTAIRNYNLIRHLAPHHEIHLLSFVRSPDDLAEAGPLHQLCRRVAGVATPHRSPVKRLLSVFLSPQPDMALRLPSAEFQGRLEAWLRETPFDVIQVEGIEMAGYGLGIREQGLGTRKQGKPLLVFDDHNAEYVLQQRAFETDARRPRRWMGALYSLIQWQKLRRYEARVCRAFDRVVAVSPADAQALQQLVPELEVTVVLNGVDTEALSNEAMRNEVMSKAMDNETLVDSSLLVFVGKMDFRPNVDAVLWFCQQILPLIRRERPSIRFVIVGREPHPRVQALAQDPRITVTGYVEDVRPYIARAAVYVVPLRMGSGTRLKVLEAMAMSQAIVSTTLGCEGIALTPGREAILADTAQEFAQRVMELLDDEERRRSMGQQARRLVEARYDWRVIVPRLEQVYG
jgi:sugar transferase (PEP-CTERM/EpsH1 system associated)